MENNTNTIGKEFTIGELAKFVSGPIVTNLFMSLLRTLDDSLFLSRYCGQKALAAFTIAMPWFMFVDAFGMLFGATSTLSSMKLGEKKREEAESLFSSMCLFSFGCGLLFTLALTFFRTEILTLLGATESLLPYGVDYMKISRFYTPMIMLSYILPRFYVIAGKPKHNIITTAISTACNFFFDWLFIAKMQIGIAGAAYANLISNIAVTLYGIIFFSSRNHEIAFGKPTLNIRKPLRRIVAIGKSQSLTSFALSFNSFLCNQVLLARGGEDFVAAYTIVGNIQFMFMNALFGLTGTLSPIISYAYGEKNPKKLSRILKQDAVLVTALDVILIAIFYASNGPLSALYLNGEEGAAIRDLVDYGLKIAPTIFLFFGYNVMAQDAAGAVGNARISTVLTVLENVIFSNLCVLVLPAVFGLNGIWWTFTAGELLTFFFTLYVILREADVYGYGRSGKASFIYE